MGQHIAGSVLHLLAFDAGLEGSLDSRLGQLWDALRGAYESLGTSAGEQLTYSDFHDIFSKRRSPHPTTYPTLGTKGAVCRHCAPALKLVVQKLCRSLLEWADTQLLLESLSDFYENLAVNDLVLPFDHAIAMHNQLAQIGVLHQALCLRCAQIGRLYFYVTEKAHYYLQHIAIDIALTHVNPRLHWTYSDEDYMGRVGQVLLSCLRARGPLKLSNAFAFRWRARTHLRWKKT